MNDLGFPYNNSSLSQWLSKFAPVQQTDQPQMSEKQEITSFEIDSLSELEYIKPDKSGKRQFAYCAPENKVYVGRYNHSQEKMIWRGYLDEGEVALHQDKDASADMGKIAEALVAVADRMKSMHKEIQDIKSIQPVTIERIVTDDSSLGRDANGRFKKKGG